MVERALPAGEFVANDCSLSRDGTQIAILTGPNMAGKSTYILGVALMVADGSDRQLRSRRGGPVGLVDRVFTRVGAQHDITGGRSTFLVEMAETANILRQRHGAKPRHPGRDGAGDEHVRRDGDSQGGGRVSAR